MEPPRASPPKLPAEARNALMLGQTTEAVRIVREKLGIGLKEAAELVDAAVLTDPAFRSVSRPPTIAAIKDAVGRFFGRAPTPPAPPPAQAAPAPARELPAAARQAIERGEVIEAIKIVREELGLGLAEAKQMVDQARKR
jgi:ribosomal protein L7/L12